MIVHLAFLVGLADVGVFARIHAALIDASPLRGAVNVRGTTDFCAIVENESEERNATWRRARQKRSRE